MDNNLLTKNVVQVLLFIISVLCFMFDSIRVFGAMALFCLVLYFLWDNNNDDKDNTYYTLR